MNQKFKIALNFHSKREDRCFVSVLVVLVVFLLTCPIPFPFSVVLIVCETKHTSVIDFANPPSLNRN